MTVKEIDDHLHICIHVHNSQFDVDIYLQAEIILWVLKSGSVCVLYLDADIILCIVTSLVRCIAGA